MTVKILAFIGLNAISVASTKLWDILVKQIIAFFVVFHRQAKTSPPPPEREINV